MSGAIPELQPSGEDISMLVMAGSHFGARNVGHQMKKYVYKKKADGTAVIDLHKTWEKIVFAARILATVENPKDICCISGRPYGQRAVLKFASHVGATPIAGRYTPGTFTNQIQKAFVQPRVLIVTDPRVDHQPVREASYVNLPVIAFCDVDSPLRYVDVAIPCNNRSVHSIGLIWWMLARETMRFRGTIARASPWDIMPDLYFYRDPEEVEKEEQAAVAAKQAAAAQVDPQWNNEAEQWNAAAPDAAAPVAGAPAPAGGVAPIAAAPISASGMPTYAATEDWGSAAAPVGDWGATASSWE